MNIAMSSFFRWNLATYVMLSFHLPRFWLEPHFVQLNFSCVVKLIHEQRWKINICNEETNSWQILPSTGNRLNFYIRLHMRSHKSRHYVQNYRCSYAFSRRMNWIIKAIRLLLWKRILSAILTSFGTKSVKIVYYTMLWKIDVTKAQLTICTCVMQNNIILYKRTVSNW